MHEKQIDYFSLRLHNFSIESLIWVLKSLQNDELKPSLTLVQSRFKECFGLNIPGKDWNFFIRKLYTEKQKLKLCNKYQDFLGQLSVKIIDQELIIILNNMVYQYKDLSVVEDFHEDYQQFLSFIDEFFCQSTQKGFDIDSKKNLEIFRLFKNKKNLEQLLQEKQVSRAIPGGMYGCALLMKHSNFKFLQEASLGRLHALVKKALNDQVLLHYKTLIIKNKNKEEFSEQEKYKLIEEAKGNITELIRQNEPEGVTLAQLPSLLYEKSQIKYDFQKMGFPKLKNFLLICPEIQLENKKNLSHIKARLKKNFLKSTEQKFLKIKSFQRQQEGTNKQGTKYSFQNKIQIDDQAKSDIEDDLNSIINIPRRINFKQLDKLQNWFISTNKTERYNDDLVEQSSQFSNKPFEFRQFFSNFLFF